jgi:hypothetical protein
VLERVSANSPFQRVPFWEEFIQDWINSDDYASLPEGFFLTKVKKILPLDIWIIVVNIA